MFILTGEQNKNNALEFDPNSTIIPIMTVISGIFYVGSSIYGMAAFAHKMYKLTKLRSTSLKTNIVELEHISKITINSGQAKLLDRTSRYVSLLSIAICSTFITFAVFFICLQFFDNDIKTRRYAFNIAILGTAMDCMVNVLCLWLQFPFTKSFYDRYCSGCGRLWNWLFTTKTERSLQNKYKASICELSVTPSIQTGKHTENIDNDKP